MSPSGIICIYLWFLAEALFNSNSVSSLILLKDSAQWVALDIFSPFQIMRHLSPPPPSCGSPFGGFSGLSQFGLACPFLTITMCAALSGLMSSLWRTAKKGNEQASVDGAGSVVPDFANVEVSGVLEVTLIFTVSPNHLMHT